MNSRKSLHAATPDRNRFQTAFPWSEEMSAQSEIVGALGRTRTQYTTKGLILQLFLIRRQSPSDRTALDRRPEMLRIPSNSGSRGDIPTVAVALYGFEAALFCGEGVRVTTLILLTFFVRSETCLRLYLRLHWRSLNATGEPRTVPLVSSLTR
jgi:hypothetical protein